MSKQIKRGNSPEFNKNIAVIKWNCKKCGKKDCECKKENKNG